MATFSVILTATDANFTATLKRAEAEMMMLNAKAAALSAVVAGLRTGLMAGAVSVAAMILPTIFATRAIGAFDEALTRAESIERSFQGRTAETTETIMNMAKTYGVASDEIASGVVEFAKAGFEYNTIMKELILPTTQLAIANQVDFATASRISTYMWQLFGKQVESSAQLLDMVNAAANESLLNVEDLGSAVEYAGSSAVVAGVKVDEFLAVLASLSQIAFQSNENLGTLINRIMISGDELENILGTSGIVVEGQVNIVKLMEALEQMTITEETASDIADLWGVRSSKTFFAALKSAEPFADILTSIRNSNGNLQKQSEKMAYTLPAIWTRIKESIVAELKQPDVIEKMKISMEKLLDTISSGKIGELLANVINLSSEFLSKTSGNLVEMVRNLLVMFTDAYPLIEKVSNGFVKIIGIVAKFPSELIAAVTAFGLLNKVLPYNSMLTIVAAAKMRWYIGHVKEATVEENKYLVEIEKVTSAKINAMHVMDMTRVFMKNDSVIRENLIKLEHLEAEMRNQSTLDMTEEARLLQTLSNGKAALTASREIENALLKEYTAMTQAVGSFERQGLQNTQAYTNALVESIKVREQYNAAHARTLELEGAYGGVQKRIQAMDMEKNIARETAITEQELSRVTQESALVKERIIQLDSQRVQNSREFLVLEDRIKELSKLRAVLDETIARGKAKVTALQNDENKSMAECVNQANQVIAAQERLAGVQEEEALAIQQLNAFKAKDAADSVSRSNAQQREIELSYMEKNANLELAATKKDVLTVKNLYKTSLDSETASKQINNALTRLMAKDEGILTVTKQGSTVMVKLQTEATKNYTMATLENAAAHDELARKVQLVLSAGMFSIMSGLMLFVQNKDPIVKAIGAVSAALGVLATVLTFLGTTKTYATYGGYAGIAAAAAGVAAMAGMYASTRKIGENIKTDINTSASEYSSQEGGFVESTGWRLIHEGEMVVPKASIASVNPLNDRWESTQRDGILEEIAKYIKRTSENTETTYEETEKLNSYLTSEEYLRNRYSVSRGVPLTFSKTETTKKSEFELEGTMDDLYTLSDAAIQAGGYIKEFQTFIVKTSLEAMVSLVTTLENTFASRTERFNEALEETIESGVTSDLEAIDLEGMYEELGGLEISLGDLPPGILESDILPSEDVSAIAGMEFIENTDLPKDWAENNLDYFYEMDLTAGESKGGGFLRRGDKAMMDRLRGIDGTINRASAKAMEYDSLTGGWANRGAGGTTEVVNNYNIDNSTNNFNEVADEDLQRYLELTGLNTRT